MFKLASDKPAAKQEWAATAKIGVNPINMTPVRQGDVIYGVDSGCSMTAAEVATGKRLWQTTVPISGEKPLALGAFVVKNGDRFFLFNEMGELVIAKLSPKEYKEIDRAKIIEPTNVSFGGRKVVWVHPAFANKCMFVRNDKEIVCVSLAE